MMAVGALTFWGGVFIWLMALVGAGLLLRVPLRDGRAFADAVERLADGVDAAAPRFSGGALGRRFADAVGRLRQRLDGLRREAEASGAFVDRALDALPDPVLLLDADRRVSRANRAARDLFGAGIAGRDLAEVLRDPKVLAAADGVLRGIEAESVDFRLSAPVQRDLACHAAGLPRAEADEAPADGAVALLAFRDFTEIRRTEQMRADFVANASHEIRTPLATLVGAIETLRDAARDDPEAQRQFLELMEQQAARMTRLVGDLLSLSRIEMNEHTAPTGRVDLRLVLARVLDGAAPAAREAGVALKLDIDETLPLAVGDAGELEQVVQNLVDNAVKYGRDGGAVEIAAGPADGGLPAAGRGPAVRLAVRDYGAGIPREHLPRLTERFYRVDTARSRALGGTGLGLAIVKHIVNRHRGALTIDSAPGKGSTFTIHLPAAAPR